MAEPPLTNGTSTPAYWSRPVADLLSELHSTPDGLSTTEAQERLQQVGPNVLKPRRHDTALRLFLSQFKSPLVLILIFAAIVSAIAGEWTDAIIVIIIVLASATLGFIQEYSASNAVEKLRAQVTIKANVLRDGKVQSISAEEIVPGDIVQLSAGSLIPADGIVLEARDFFVNQAVLTGETFPGRKETRSCRGKCRDARTGQYRVYGYERAQRFGPRTHRADRLSHRVRADCRPPDPAPTGDRVRTRHPPFRPPAHPDHDGAGSARLCHQRYSR